MKQHPEMGKWFEYDLTQFKPDIYVKDREIYKLGHLEIKTFLSPGHSAGSICYHVGDVLFSGDVLFHRKVGKTEILSGSKDKMVTSVRRLYRELPDETKVYPGHGQFTDIGTEKTENEEVTLTKVNIQN
jgi:glyoxylase-like metal-dependent hydrolase (beta-lactamase superfamily II)